jgi:hypothetical protein
LIWVVEVRKVGGVGDSLAWAARLPPTLWFGVGMIVLSLLLPLTFIRRQRFPGVGRTIGRPPRRSGYRAASTLSDQPINLSLHVQKQSSIRTLGVLSDMIHQVSHIVPQHLDFRFRYLVTPLNVACCLHELILLPSLFVSAFARSSTILLKIDSLRRSRFNVF